MGCVTIWQLVGRVFAAAVLRFFVAVAYATGLNAVIFLPLAQVRAQTVPTVPAAKAEGSEATGGGLAKTLASPAAAAGSSQLVDALNAIQRQNRLTDGTGAIAASLGYDGDWGMARIAGQEHVSSDAGMEAFYRFQSQEAEIFPLAALNITDNALETWLDELQLHHFPYREYSAGLAVFMSQDPAKQSISPYAAMGANPANLVDPTGMVPRWTFKRPQIRDVIFEAAWGSALILALAAFRPMYQDMQGTLGYDLIDVAIVGGSRFVANLANNFFSNGRVEINEYGDQKIMVRAVRLTREVESHAAANDFGAIISLEFLEAMVSMGTGGLATVLGAGDLGVYAAAFAGYAIADAAGDTIRDAYVLREKGYRPEYAYVLDDSTGAVDALWGVVVRRNSVDVVFYTAMLLTWSLFLKPEDRALAATITGGMFFMRNAGYRVIKRLTWNLARTYLKEKCCGTNRRQLVAFQDFEHHSVYIDDQGQAFAWNYRTGERRNIDNFSRIVIYARAHWSRSVPQNGDQQTWEDMYNNAQQGRVRPLPPPQGHQGPIEQHPLIENGDNIDGKADEL